MDLSVDSGEQDDSNNVEKNIDSSCFTHVTFESSSYSQSIYNYENSKSTSSFNSMDSDNFIYSELDVNEHSG